MSPTDAPPDSQPPPDTKRRTHRRRWWLLAGGLVVLGWLVWFPPALHHLAPLLSHYLSRSFGMQVVITGLMLDSGGTGLVATGITVSEQATAPPLLTGESVKIGLSLGDWFTTGKPLSVVVQGVSFQGDSHRLTQSSPDRPLDPWALWAAIPVGSLRVSHIHGTLSGEAWAGVWLDIQQGHFHLNQDGNLQWTISGQLTHGPQVATLSLSGRWQQDHSWQTMLQIAGLNPSLLPGLPLQTIKTPVSLGIQAAGGGQKPITAQWNLLLGKGQVALPKLFRWPFPVTRLAAYGSADSQDSLWNLRVDSFDLTNDHGSGEGNFALTGMGSPNAHLDLAARARGVPTEKANYYYPTAIMSSKVVTWLDHSLLQGRVTDARVRIKGPLHKIPFHTQHQDFDGSETIFHIEGDVADAAVQFYPKLPPVSHAQTRLIFDRLSMEAQVSDGTLVNSRKVQGKVFIADMLHHPILEIDATALADLSTLWQHLVAHPALGWDHAIGMAGTELAGEGKLRLAIRIPLDTPKKATYQGELDLADSWVRLPFLQTPFSKVRGLLKGDNSQVQVMVEHADYGGVSVFGTVEAAEINAPDKASLHVKVRGSLPKDWLAEKLSRIAEKQVAVTGDVPLNVTLDRNAGNRGFQVESKLSIKNLGIQGFPGLDKQPKEAGEATLSGQLANDGNLQVNKLLVKLGGMEISGGGGINLRGLSQDKPTGLATALQLKGVLPGESLAPLLAPLLGEEGSVAGPIGWRLKLSNTPGKSGVLLNMKADLDRVKVEGAYGWRKERGADGQWLMTGDLQESGLLTLNRIQGKAGNLELTGYGSWRLRDGTGKILLKKAVLDRSKGTITLARKEEKNSGGKGTWHIQGDMQELDLSSQLQKSPAPEERGDKEIIATATEEEAWPRFDVSLKAKHLTLAHGTKGAEMKLATTSTGSSLRLSELTMTMGGKPLNGEGELSWLPNKELGPYHGHLKLAVGDIGKLLKGMDWHQGMKGGEGTLNIQVEGTVPRGARLLRHLNGKADVQAKDGVIQQAEFLTTLLGLLSIPELPKLLSGDRPDLEGEGFYYKKLYGKLRLVEGVLKSDELTLSGPSLTIVASGDVDLPSRQLKLLVGVRVFQTLDKIINKIPVIGKLITGRRNALWETQFDVTESLADPKWRVRPVDSLVPGIFRDILELPGKLLHLGDDAAVETDAK